MFVLFILILFVQSDLVEILKSNGLLEVRNSNNDYTRRLGITVGDGPYAATNCLVEVAYITHYGAWVCKIGGNIPAGAQKWCAVEDEARSKTRLKSSDYEYALYVNVGEDCTDGVEMDSFRFSINYQDVTDVSFEGKFVKSDGRNALVKIFDREGNSFFKYYEHNSDGYLQDDNLISFNTYGDYLSMSAPGYRHKLGIKTSGGTYSGTSCEFQIAYSTKFGSWQCEINDGISKSETKWCDIPLRKTNGITRVDRNSEFAMSVITTCVCTDGLQIDKVYWKVLADRIYGGTQTFTYEFDNGDMLKQSSGKTMVSFTEEGYVHYDC